MFLCGRHTIQPDVILGVGLGIRRYRNVFDATWDDEPQQDTGVTPLLIDLMDNMRYRHRAREDQELPILAFSVRRPNAPTLETSFISNVAWRPP